MGSFLNRSPGTRPVSYQAPSSFSSISLYGPSGQPSQLGAALSAILAQSDEEAAFVTSTSSVESSALCAPSAPSAPSAQSVHAPEVRSFFQTLRQSLKDVDAVYREGSTADSDDSFVPTEKTLEQKERLAECSDFFQGSMQEHFEKFVHYQKQVEQEQTFVTQCLTLLDVLEVPASDNDAFRTCAQDICSALRTFTTHMTAAMTEAKRKSEMHWVQYKGFRDLCRPVRLINCDPICSVCFASEIEVTLNCGHVFCTNCSQRCMSCPQCREVITRRTKMFFS